MRKILLGIMCALFSITAFSQTSFKFGIKGGGNLSFVKENIKDYTYYVLPESANPVTLDGVNEPLLKKKNGFGFYGGGFMEISPRNSDNKFKLQIELLYSALFIDDKKNSHTVVNNYSFDTATEVKYHLQRLSLPVIVEYYITPGFNVHLGPTFNYITGGERKASGFAASADVSNKIIEEVSSYASYYDINKKFHLGLTAGAAYYIYKGLFVDASYNPLFGKVETKDELLEQSVQSVQLGVGYKF